MSAASPDRRGSTGYVDPDEPEYPSSDGKAERRSREQADARALTERRRAELMEAKPRELGVKLD